MKSTTSHKVFYVVALALFIPSVGYGAVPAPKCSLDAQPRFIHEGEPTRISWNTVNSYDVSIAYIGNVSENDFSIRYPSAGRADYLLTARGEGGVATCKVSVSVANQIVQGTQYVGPAYVPWYSPIVSAVTYVPNSIYRTVFGYDDIDEVVYVQEPVYESYRVIEKEYVPYERYEPYQIYDPYKSRHWLDEPLPYREPEVQYESVNREFYQPQYYIRNSSEEDSE